MTEKITRRKVLKIGTVRCGWRGDCAAHFILGAA